MALPSTLDGDVRTTGSDLNAGYFDRTAGGTDFSQQNTAQVTFNGGAVTATTVGASATLTVSGYTVTGNEPGNTLRIASGSNFIAGLYYIQSANSGANTLTLDRNATTGNGSALVANLGGSLLSPAIISSDAASAIAPSVGWRAYVKSGTYTMNGTANVSGGIMRFALGGLDRLEGYSSTHGDQGAYPRFQATTSNFFNLVYFGNSSAIHIASIEFYTNPADGLLGTVGIFWDSPTESSRVDNCRFLNLAGGVNVQYFGIQIQKSYFNALTSYAINAASSTPALGSTGIAVHECVAVACTATPFVNTGSGNFWSRCLALGGTSGVSGFSVGGKESVWHNCTAWGNAADGFNFTVGATKSLWNCLAWGNGTGGAGWGFNEPSGDSFLWNCGGGGNTSGNTTGFDSFHNHGFISVANNPFVNSGATINNFADAITNFYLNGDAAGGLLCAGAGDPLYLDIGAIQTKSILLATPAPHRYQIGRRSF